MISSKLEKWMKRYSLVRALALAILVFLNTSFVYAQSAEDFKKKGEFYTKQSNYNLAIFNYTRAIEAKPQLKALDLYIVYLGRAVDYFQQKNFPQAVSDDTKAIEILQAIKNENPELKKAFLGRAYLQRGMAYDLENNLVPAISDFTKFIEIEPKDMVAYSFRGSEYYRQNKLIQAISDYNISIENTPNVKSYEGLAHIYFDLKEYEKAWKNVHKTEALRNKYEALGYEHDNEDLKFLDKLKKASGRDK